MPSTDVSHLARQVKPQWQIDIEPSSERERLALDRDLGLDTLAWLRRNHPQQRRAYNLLTAAIKKIRVALEQLP